MSIGHGLGELWGGQDLVDDDPVTLPGSLPYTFDFTDEPDGPFPGLWTFLSLDVVAGSVASTVESVPSSHYSVVGGAALWEYTRTPATGNTYLETGVSVSPFDVLHGPNASLSLIFLPPSDAFGAHPDSRQLEITVGLRADTALTSYVGGRVSARWDTGSGWSPVLAVDAVRSSAVVPLTTLASALPFDVNKDFDHWSVAQRHEFTVTVWQDRLYVALDGVIACSVVIPVGGDVNPVITVRAYDETAGVFVPRAVILGVQIRAFRDESRYEPAALLFGDTMLESAKIPTLYLPLGKLLALGTVRRVGSRSFEFVSEAITDELGIRRRWNAGARVRAIDKYVGQDFSRVVVDLAYERVKHIGQPYET